MFEGDTRDAALSVLAMIRAGVKVDAIFRALCHDCRTFVDTSAPLMATMLGEKAKP
jgi:hypothetical protein